MRKILLSAFMAATAALTVSADYPTLYLRGEMTNDGWGVNEELRFNNDNGTYSLHLDQLSGRFKIADAGWTVETTFGANSGGDGEVAVSGGGSYTMTRPGKDFGCDGTLTDVTLKFVYNEGQDLILEVTTGGIQGGDDRLSGTLPVLYINVYTDEAHSSLNNEIISKDLDHKNYFSFAEYWLDLNGCEWMEAEGAASVGSKESPLPLEIKARGNWTRRGFAKKPFKLKLGKKQNLLGLTKSKHFAILAHADDQRGYMKNFVGFNLGKRIGLPWTPGQQPVEVVINGDYRGLYFLTESIRVDEERVNITELDDNVSDPALASGGYLVELDNYDEENQIRMEEKSCVDNQLLDVLRVTWDTPEVYSDLQKRFITDQFSAMNDAVGANSDNLWSYLDLDDAARYYIVEEIISHTESYHGSTYLFRDRGEGQKWHFSPLWDCGNAFSGPDNDFFYNHDLFGNTWIPSMRTNETFNEKVSQTWLWFMNNGFNGVYDDIDAYVSHLEAAAKADFRRWDGQPAPDGGQGVADNRDMQSRKNEVVGKLRAKTEWLKQVFGDYTASPSAAEPARDTTPAAPLPDYLTSGVENVDADADFSSSPVEYFDLTGRRVANPAEGSVVIERRGPSARTVRF
ncbi:MAG: CotH kinase family protein [Muribaculaceae bacterium]|nr:CotH kinase family protein [Muribaculaceae bacterium]